VLKINYHYFVDYVISGVQTFIIKDRRHGGINVTYELSGLKLESWVSELLINTHIKF
jgi:hypothetical protein